MHGIRITVAPAEPRRFKGFLPQDQVGIISFRTGIHITEMIGGINVDSCSPGMIAESSGGIPVDMAGNPSSIHGFNQAQQGNCTPVHYGSAILNERKGFDKIISCIPVNLN